MTKIKLCGIRSARDIEAVNDLLPDYIGFVFAKESRRYISPDTAGKLKKMLDPSISAVGVFVDEKPDIIAELLGEGVIDTAQLHGAEGDEYIRLLRRLTDKPIIQAFKIKDENYVRRADASLADYVLLDSGAGCGKMLDWNLVKSIRRPYFLAGGLDPTNVSSAISELHPYAVDVSSGIESDGVKDKTKMTEFVSAARRAEKGKTND